jgi:hypothetical protein
LCFAENHRKKHVTAHVKPNSNFDNKHESSESFKYWLISRAVQGASEGSTQVIARRHFQAGNRAELEQQGKAMAGPGCTATMQAAQRVFGQGNWLNIRFTIKKAVNYCSCMSGA